MQEGDLKIVRLEQGYCVRMGDVFLGTPDAKLLAAPTRKMAEAIKGELLAAGGPDELMSKARHRDQEFCAYNLLCVLISFVQGPRWKIGSHKGFLEEEPVFSLSGFPPVRSFQDDAIAPVLRYFEKHHLRSASGDTRDVRQLGRHLDAILPRLSPAAQSVWANLRDAHKGQVLPTLLLLGELSPEEYGTAVFACSPEVVWTAGLEVVDGMGEIDPAPPSGPTPAGEKRIADRIGQYRAEGELGLWFIAEFAAERAPRPSTRKKSPSKNPRKPAPSRSRAKKR